ncbi:hypothetical protein AB1Y20_001295 [Prymnesium parvum]|uniref:Uncharacterized protein n=1 Tax=Prymnesium parvum TaxID=97485 RepID=A0AB34K7E0_PRYPA
MHFAVLSLNRSSFNTHVMADKSSINKQTTEAMHMSPTTTGNAPSASPTAEGDAGRGGALGLDAEDIGGVIFDEAEHGAGITMGKSATAFKDIGKACSDLLTKDYKVGKNTVEVKSKTSNGVTFTPSATNSNGKIAGSLAAKYEFAGGISSEVTLLTSGVVEATVEGSPVKDVTITLDCARPDSTKPGLLSSAKCTVDYKKESFTTKAAYDIYPGLLACAGSYAYDALTFGLSADYSTKKGAFTKYAGACQFVQPDFSIIGKLAASVGKSPTYTGMYYHKVSSDMQVGAELSHETGKEVGLAFGGMYKADKDTTVKAKVDGDGMLFCSYKQKLSPLATMTLAAQVNTVNLSDNKHQYGFILNITA